MAPAAHQIPFHEPDPDTANGMALVLRPVRQTISGRNDGAVPRRMMQRNPRWVRLLIGR